MKLKYFACDKCAYRGFDKNGLRTHTIQKHSDFRPYKCKLCPMAFPRATSFYQHRGTHENNLKTTKDFSCPICGKAFRNQSSSDFCKKRHQLERVKCVRDDCDKTFLNTENMKKHLKQSHNENHEKIMHLCHVCDKSFPSKSDRNRHIRLVHENLEATIPCKICPKKFLNQQRLKRHQLVHNDSVFKCPFEPCNSSRKTKYDLDHHYKQKHGEVNHRKSLEERLATRREKNQKVMCDLCKIWIKRKNKQEHLKTHESKVSMICIIGGCSEDIYFSRDKNIHTYNLPSQLYAHLTQEHGVDLNKSCVCVEVKCKHCTGKLSLKSLKPQTKTSFYVNTATSWKTALKRHMDESHVTLAQGLDIKNDWKTHYIMGTPFMKERVQEVEA